MAPDDRAEIASLAKQLAEALSQQPDDYASRVAWAIAFQRAATQVLGDALEKPANRFLKSMETRPFAERAEAIETFRHDTAMLSLAVKCQKTGNASGLYLRVRDPLDPERGGDYYAIQHRRDSDGRTNYGHTSKSLPNIELVPNLGAGYRGKLHGGSGQKRQR